MDQRAQQAGLGLPEMGHEVMPTAGAVDRLAAVCEDTLDRLLGASSAAAAPDAATLAARDLVLTDALVRLAYHLRFGKANPRELYPDWNFSRSLGAIDPVRALEAAIASESLAATVEQFAPQLPIYGRLRGALARYRAIEASGGWPRVPPGPCG